MLSARHIKACRGSHLLEDCGKQAAILIQHMPLEPAQQPCEQDLCSMHATWMPAGALLPQGTRLRPVSQVYPQVSSRLATPAARQLIRHRWDH